MESPEHQCDAFECRALTNLNCPKCKQSHFCGKEHQTSVWHNRHKALCQDPDRDITVDGYELCERILKLNDLVDGTLTGLYFQGAEFDLLNNKVTALSDVRPDAPHLMVDSPEGFIWSEHPPENERHLNNAYWAMRSMSSAFSMTTVLQTILQELGERGKKYIKFVNGKSEPLKLSIASPELVLFAFKPTVLVMMDMKGRRQRTGKEVVGPTHQLVVIVDDHVIDISTGRFWMFDSLSRPVMVVPRDNYVSLMGQELQPQMTVDAFIKKLSARGSTMIHTATLLFMLYRRLGIDWKERGPVQRKGIPLQTNLMKVNQLNGLHDKNFTDVFEAYMNEAETPMTRAMRDLHRSILDQYKLLEQTGNKKEEDEVSREREDDNDIHPIPSEFAVSDECIYSSDHDGDGL